MITGVLTVVLLMSLIPSVPYPCRQVQDKFSDITTQAQVKAQEIGQNVSTCPCCCLACTQMF